MSKKLSYDLLHELLLTLTATSEIRPVPGYSRVIYLYVAVPCISCTTIPCPMLHVPGYCEYTRSCGKSGLSQTAERPENRTSYKSVFIRGHGQVQIYIDISIHICIYGVRKIIRGQRQVQIKIWVEGLSTLKKRTSYNP